jgi:hypothetical protein
MCCLFLLGSGLVVAAARKTTTPGDRSQELKLWNVVSPKKGSLRASAHPGVKVTPGELNEATKYYKDIRPYLKGFPKTALADSSIGDMLVYFGFPALPPAELERLDPMVLHEFAKVRAAISTPEFEAAYRSGPWKSDDLLAARFFAPKILNVRDPQVNHVPVGGFGWRKLLRFRAREGSAAHAAGLDAFYLLFNFTSGSEPRYPDGVHAAQIQAILTPVYPTGGKHRDAYFLVYESLASATPGKAGFFLIAAFDLAGAVPENKYYVPTACGQCHGTESSDQGGGKVNYLDTDHWIDRTGDDFTKVPPGNVLVDRGTAGIVRVLNAEIEKQNAAVIKQSGGDQFALLAVRKWLELHPATAPSSHAPPLRRGFIAKAGDRQWTEGVPTDEQLLPLLNQYCFRCHSSVHFHVFQKQAVFDRKPEITGYVEGGLMPQDRVLPQATKEKLLRLVNDLK